MKKIYQLSLIITALLVIFAYAAHTADFVDPAAAFSFTAPVGWDSVDSADIVNYVAANEISQINISQESSDGVTLDDFIKAFPSELKASLEKFKLISSGKTKIDGVQAGFWIYSAKVEGVSLQFKSYVIFNNDSIYSVVFCTTPQYYKTDLTTVDSIIRSWKWTP